MEDSGLQSRKVEDQKSESFCPVPREPKDVKGLLDSDRKRNSHMIMSSVGQYEDENESRFERLDVLEDAKYNERALGGGQTKKKSLVYSTSVQNKKVLVKKTLQANSESINKLPPLRQSFVPINKHTLEAVDHSNEVAVAQVYDPFASPPDLEMAMRHRVVSS